MRYRVLRLKRNMKTRVLFRPGFYTGILERIEPLDGMKFETDPCTVEKIRL